VYKALHHLQHGDRESAVRELERLESLWDGRGFADAYYEKSGWYETYKLALAFYVYKAISHRDSVDKYTVKLMSINPYTTLYRDNTGEEDLNLETATITLLALYSTPPNTFTQKTNTHDHHCYYINSYNSSNTNNKTLVSKES
jgi:hypothetical protein